MNSNLKKYGLISHFEQEATLYSDLFLARVCEQYRDLYKVVGEQGELVASVSGKLSYHANSRMSFPAVGDWVMVDRIDSKSGNAIIHHILTRKSVFARQAAGTANEQQIVAANIDTIFICMSLNADFNLRRVERYLTIAWDSMATPVIILTKSDLCDDLQKKISEILSVSPGVDIVACSSKNEQGYEAIISYVEEGKTIAFIGSSGVGKSTLINRIIGRDILATKNIREDDDKGRHTTTHRQLILLPNGGIVIDTPGMRELQICSGNLSKTFEDIEELAANCKYKDCSHGNEAGCMVKNAIEDGTLSKSRFESYQKLQREMSYDGLNSRQIENKKINDFFGAGGKTLMKEIKKRSRDKSIR